MQQRSREWISQKATLGRNIFVEEKTSADGGEQLMLPPYHVFWGRTLLCSNTNRHTGNDEPTLGLLSTFLNIQHELNPHPDSEFLHCTYHRLSHRKKESVCSCKGYMQLEFFHSNAWHFPHTHRSSTHKIHLTLARAESELLTTFRVHFLRTKMLKIVFFSVFMFGRWW